jgi:hypothetical protein
MVGSNYRLGTGRGPDDVAMIGDLEEMVSYRKNVTGIEHTVFISPKGNARHSPRVKVAIDPPDSLNPRSATAAITIDGVVIGKIDPQLAEQVRRFVRANRAVLRD